MCRSFAESLKSVDPGHSPIELALRHALQIVFMGLKSQAWHIDQRDCLTLTEIEKIVAAEELVGMLVFSQAIIAPYRVDFLVALNPGDGRKSAFVAVECDGHEWHERTKEQAAKDKKRDRRLQEQGIAVLRVTGSEVWKSPVACAHEIAANLSGIALNRFVP